MVPGEWLGLLSGVILTLGGLWLARAGLRGEQLQHQQQCTLACPRLSQPVQCQIDQDIRTGQWKQVHTCSAFGDHGRVLCGQECAQLMNLGVQRPLAVRT